MNIRREESRPVEVGAVDFSQEVLQSELPVLLAFSTEWSRPCHIIEPVLDDIRTVPSLLTPVAGSVRGRIVGTATKAAILSRVQSLDDAATT